MTTKLSVVNNLTKNLSRNFGKMSLKARKYSPEILVVTGVVGVVTSAVMACKATTKLDEVLAESKEKMEDVRNYVEENGYSSEYTEEDEKKDIALLQMKSAVAVAKLYAPSVALGALSLTAILTSNNILRKRNIALAAAYATIDKNFKDYRARVIERFGEQLDKELRFNIKPKEIEEVKKDENGNDVIEKTTVNAADPNLYSDFAKVYDDGCTGWDKNPEYNLMFLRRQQAYANEQLKRQGYLFLNDVYDMLGIPKTKAGQIVGWIYDEKNPIGDNFVDFGIYNINIPKNNDFVNGYESTIILDFNVDGNILDLI